MYIVGDVNYSYNNNIYIFVCSTNFKNNNLTINFKKIPGTVLIIYRIFIDFPYKKEYNRQFEIESYKYISGIPYKLDLNFSQRNLFERPKVIEIINQLLNRKNKLLCKHF